MMRDSLKKADGFGGRLSADLLNSWKDVAAYLGKGVRTVQRWEALMGLPVRRIGGAGGTIVCARKSEIEAWLMSESRLRAGSAPQTGAKSRRGGRLTE